jgi:hypothetical protein
MLIKYEYRNHLDCHEITNANICYTGRKETLIRLIHARNATQLELLRPSCCDCIAVWVRANTTLETGGNER